MAEWILQSNAARIDVASYYRPGALILHGVRRYPDRIAVGESVFLWRASGGTRHRAGIVALATVLELAELRAHDAPVACLDHKVRLPKLRAVLRVDEVRFTPDEGMILREDVRRVPEMATHPIVTSNTGTDFALTEEQAKALRELWGR